MKSRLCYCYTPWLCAGVLVGPDNVVREAAPILAWAVGGLFARLRDWLYGQGGGWQVVRPGCPAHSRPASA